MTATCHNASCPISLFEHTEGHGECIPAVTEPTECSACAGGMVEYRVCALDQDGQEIRGGALLACGDGEDVFQAIATLFARHQLVISCVAVYEWRA